MRPVICGTRGKQKNLSILRRYMKLLELLSALFDSHDVADGRLKDNKIVLSDGLREYHILSIYSDPEKGTIYIDIEHGGVCTQSK